jgi:hypothetical protein
MLQKHDQMPPFHTSILPPRLLEMDRLSSVFGRHSTSELARSGFIQLSSACDLRLSLILGKTLSW